MSRKNKKDNNEKRPEDSNSGYLQTTPGEVKKTNTPDPRQNPRNLPTENSSTNTGAPPAPSQTINEDDNAH